MRQIINFVVLSLATMILSVGAGRGVTAEQMVGNATEGLRFARDHCAECHQVEAGEVPHILPIGQSFHDIADDPKMTALALRVFLRTPHFDMPDLMLSEAQTDDVIAYILSLK